MGTYEEVLEEGRGPRVPRSSTSIDAFIGYHLSISLDISTNAKTLHFRNEIKRADRNCAIHIV